MAKGKEMGGFIREDRVAKLFWLCWLAYFVSYLGRLGYSAAMAEIMLAEGFTGAEAGLVGTGFFICYGAGQLVAGYIGDKLSPKWMVLFGLVCSGALNLFLALAHSARAMLVVWCLNGLIQATLWTPILRIIAEWFPPERRKKACVNIATTYPSAMLVAYAGSAGLIALAGWRAVFLSACVLLVAMGGVWAVGISRLERCRVEAVAATRETKATAEGKQTLRFPLLVVALMCLALVMQGILRDGVMSWVPAYLTATFDIGTALAILTTTVLPVVNLAGVYAAEWLYKRWKAETRISVLLFSLAAVAGGVLLWLGSASMPVAVVSFSVMTASMLGVNMMLVSFVPTYFTRFGRVSFVAGLLNSSVYIGSSIATYGIGAIADGLGWNSLLLALLLVAVAGAVLCALAMPGWRRFLKRAE